MHRPIIIYAIGLLSLTACVPRAQYNSLATERDAYQRQRIASDSLADLLRLRYGEVVDPTLPQDPAVLPFRRINDLIGTNLSLKEDLAAATLRYETLLSRQADLLPAGSGDLQRKLVEREAELRQREDDLRKGEKTLGERRRILSQGLTSNTTSHVGQGTTPLNPESTSTVTASRVAGELEQLLQSAIGTGFTVANPVAGLLVIDLENKLLFDSDRLVSADGERLLRKLVATLRNYRGATYTIIAHAGAAEGSADAAYRVSSQRAVNLAIQLTRFGLDPGTIVAGAQGYFGPGGDGDSATKEGTQLRVDYREAP